MMACHGGPHTFINVIILLPYQNFIFMKCEHYIYRISKESIGKDLKSNRELGVDLTMGFGILWVKG